MNKKNENETPGTAIAHIVLEEILGKTDTQKYVKMALVSEYFITKSFLVLAAKVNATHYIFMRLIVVCM